jgi:Holliday junction DNA helicase RuvA
MVVGLRGVVVKKEPTFLNIDVAGVIYRVNISLNCSNSVELNQSLELLITQIIREDANLLYGFISEAERELFERLIKINGVGAKVAMAICSTFTPEVFGKIVSTKDAPMLKKVVGVGAKMASRILVELDGFEITEAEGNNSKSDAILALETLGFKRDAIVEALLGESGDTNSLVKIGLKRLSKV